mgnify:FL=1
MLLTELPAEIIVSICDNLNDGDKINLISTCRDLFKTVNLMYFESKVRYNAIKDISYKYNFKSIIVDKDDDVKNLINFKCLERILFDANFNNDIKGCIPPSVESVIFGWSFNKCVRGCFSNSLVYLTFGYSFDQDIKDCIPPSVKYLNLGYSFDRSIKECLPPYLTHLKLSWYFNQNIVDCLPNTLTCLEIGGYFSKSLKDVIPPSLTKLIFTEEYMNSVYFDPEFIPHSVDDIIFI